MRAASHGVLIVVNDRVDVAMASGAGGVHVGHEDLPPREARMLLGSSVVIGVSTHSLDEGIAAADEPVDYVAIGPVFPTATKPNAFPVVGVETVRLLAAAIARPVVAIGGIDARNARAVLDAGAHAIAVIGALYDDAGSVERGAEAMLRAIGEGCP